MVLPGWAGSHSCLKNPMELQCPTEQESVEKGNSAPGASPKHPPGQFLLGKCANAIVSMGHCSPEPGRAAGTGGGTFIPESPGESGSYHPLALSALSNAKIEGLVCLSWSLKGWQRMAGCHPSCLSTGNKHHRARNLQQGELGEFHPCPSTANPSSPKIHTAVSTELVGQLGHLEQSKLHSDPSNIPLPGAYSQGTQVPAERDQELRASSSGRKVGVYSSSSGDS